MARHNTAIVGTQTKTILEQEEKKVIEDLNEIQLCTRQHLSANVRLGYRLIFIKKELLKHGEFEPWCRKLNLSSANVSRYTSLAKFKSSIMKDLNIDICTLNLSANALVRLTAKGIPQELIHQVIEQAQAGIAYTEHDVENLLKQHKRKALDKKPAISDKRQVLKELALLRKSSKTMSREDIQVLKLELEAFLTELEDKLSDESEAQNTIDVRAVQSDEDVALGKSSIMKDLTEDSTAEYQQALNPALVPNDTLPST